jgi:uncharacterized membrane protein
MWPIFKSLLQQAQIAQSRSSVINPLQWALLILVVLLLALGAEARTPPWLLVGAAASLGLALLFLLAAYVYFAMTNPDSLRSESYSLVKTALEKKYLGDSLSGMKEFVDTIEGSDKKALGSGGVGKIGQSDE